MSMLLGFIFGNGKRLIAIVVMLALVGLWARFQYVESRHTADQAALAHTRALLTAAEDRATIASAALEAANRLHELENTLHAALSQGHNEIHEAVNAEETRALFVAWAVSDRRLCDAAPGGCGPQRA